MALQGTTEDVERAAQELRRGASQNKSEDKQQEAPEQLSDQQLSRRSVTHSWESDGFLLVKARLPAESGKLLLGALETAMKEIPGATFTARRADALLALTGIFLKSHREAPDAGHPPLNIAGGEQPRHSAHIHHIQQTRRPPVAAYSARPRRRSRPTSYYRSAELKIGGGGSRWPTEREVRGRRIHQGRQGRGDLSLARSPRSPALLIPLSAGHWRFRYAWGKSAGGA